MARVYCIKRFVHTIKTLVSELQQTLVNIPTMEDSLKDIDYLLSNPKDAIAGDLHWTRDIRGK